MTDVMSITRIQKTFGERQIMNCIQQVCFSTAVQSQQAVHFGLEIQGDLLVIFKIYQPELL